MEFQDQFILLRNTFLGDIQIRYYGIIIVTAMLAAAWVAARLAKARKYDPEHIWGGLTWAIFPGIIGARLWFVIFPPNALVLGCQANAPVGAECRDFAWFLANIGNLQDGPLAIWSGGLSIFGAVLGGLLGAWLYLGPLHNPVSRFFYWLFYPINYVLGFIFWLPTAVYRNLTKRDFVPFRPEPWQKVFPDEGLPMLPWLDLAAIALPLAQFIGRWANYVNQELYGSPTTLPWGITIDAAHRVAPYTSPVNYPPETLFHPLFLYEGLWSLLAFFALYNLYTQRRNEPFFKVGDFFLLYIIQYSVIRFLLEFLRVEVAYLPGTTINSSQVAVALAFVVALLALLARRKAYGDKPYDEQVIMPETPKPEAHKPHAEAAQAA